MTGAAAVTGASILLGVVLVAGTSGAGCSGRPISDDDTGSVGLSLRLPTGTTVNAVAYAISRGGVPLMTGTIDVRGDAANVTLLSRIPAATGYAIRLDAVDTAGTTSCSGTGMFNVFAGQTIGVTVTLLCRESSATGVILVDGRFDNCPVIDSLTVSPLQANVGGTITLTATARDLDAADVLSFGWINSPALGTYGPTFVTRGASGFTATTTLTSAVAGTTVATLTVSDGPCTTTAQAALSFAVVGGPGGTGGVGGAGGTSCIETNPPPSHLVSCQACLAANANPPTDGCCPLAATDPEGFARCQAASACMRQGGPPVGVCNIGGDTTTCYCGVHQATCDVVGHANGPCVVPITAAAARNVINRTTDAPTPSQVLARYGDPNFAIGRAANIQAIAGAFCPAECAPELGGGGAAGTGGGAGGQGGTGGNAANRIQVVAKCQDGASSSVIGVTFKIYNLEASDKQWSDIKVRYYFTGDGTIPLVDFDYFSNPTWNLNRSLLVVTATSSYVELGFSPSAGTLFAFDNIAGSGDIQLRIHPADFHAGWNVSQADDHSFAACTGGSTAFAPRATMPGTYLSQQAWGTTP